MKIKQYLFLAGFCTIFAALIIVGCKKSDNSTNTSPTDTSSAQDDANANYAIQDSKNIADGAAKQQAVERLMSGCEIITRHKDTINHVVGDSLLDINFGSTPCQCVDGKYRQGHILVWYMNGFLSFITPGDSTVMGFNGYAVGGTPTSMIKVAGTRTLINIGADTGDNLYSWKFHANLTLTYSDGGTATWNSTRTNTLTNYNSSYYFKITGSASGVSKSGANYNIIIDSNNPLYVQPPVYTHYKFINTPCRYIEAGKLTITVSTFSYPIYVSFANGSTPPVCESNATATINGVTFNFTQQ